MEYEVRSANCLPSKVNVDDGNEAQGVDLFTQKKKKRERERQEQTPHSDQKPREEEDEG